MRIQGSSPNTEASAATATQLDQIRSKSQGRSTGSAAGGQDTVELSADAQLASTAAKAVADAPAIRQDVVAAAKQKLVSGQIGSDPMALADRLIDHLLER